MGLRRTWPGPCNDLSAAPQFLSIVESLVPSWSLSKNSWWIPTLVRPSQFKYGHPHAKTQYFHRFQMVIYHVCHWWIMCSLIMRCINIWYMKMNLNIEYKSLLRSKAHVTKKKSNLNIISINDVSLIKCPLLISSYLIYYLLIFQLSSTFISSLHGSYAELPLQARFPELPQGPVAAARAARGIRQDGQLGQSASEDVAQHCVAPEADPRDMGSTGRRRVKHWWQLLVDLNDR